MVRSCAGREPPRLSSCPWFEPASPEESTTPIVKPRVATAVALALVLLISTPIGALAFPRQPVTEWVRDLYTAQAARIARAQPLEESDVLVLFTTELAAFWQEARKAREFGATSDDVLDAFFGWNVTAGTKVSFTRVIKVLGTSEAPTLLIDVVVAGVPRRVVLDALQDGGSWRIANITYDEGEDFSSFERRLAHP
ncbi:MAG: hypothetical protein JO216_20675 [Hyphomicrobiales bacterium]|nr:hypothetical protein [Hyphomicrobiales bacterium]